jgi:AbrB family looped-hinge helix DNA binding protein
MSGIRATSKVGDKYTTTIPKEIREYLKIEKGDILLWRVRVGRVEVEKIPLPEEENE